MKTAFGVAGVYLALLAVAVTPAWSGSVYNYDRLNRLKLVRHPDCSMDVFFFDEAGLKTGAKKITNPTLEGVEISGPLEVPENSHARYTVYALYPDDIEAPVSDAVWTVDSTIAAFHEKENGLLSIGGVNAEIVIPISVSYQDCSGVRTAALNIVVKKEALANASSCDGFPVRVVKYGEVLSCHTNEASGYEAAHHGARLQSAMPASGIELTTRVDKDITLECYQDATFTTGSSVLVNNIELTKGTLIIR